MERHLSDSTDWSIDFATRTVKHVSGAEATFYAYTNEKDWLECDVAQCLNPDLYPNGPDEFARRAKETAIKGDMKYHR